jgi:hypothetical protein
MKKVFEKIKSCLPIWSAVLFGIFFVSLIVNEIIKVNPAFADGVHSDTVGNLLHITNVVEKGDGYWLATEELVAVKHTEIVRIWAELGDLYMDELPE